MVVAGPAAHYRAMDKRRLIAASVAAVACAATLFVATATASATTWQQGTVYLRNPVPPNFGTSCVVRDITLKQGSYRWKAYLVPRFRPDASIDSTRHLRLRSSRYRWTDCIGAPSGSYEQCSWLDDLANGIGGAASNCHWPPARFGDGYYHFGSGLDWEAP
jgi:hypothetical protein